MEMVDEPTSFYTKVSDMHRGAEWFFWIAALSVINSLVVTFGAMGDTLFGLGGTRVIDQYLRAGSLGGVEAWWLPLSLLLPLAFAGLGYLAWRGSDKAFIIGMFLYAVDAMIVIGFRDFFAFGFHLVALFFMFKGLLASRKRYDPSV